MEAARQKAQKKRRYHGAIDEASPVRVEIFSAGPLKAGQSKMDKCDCVMVSASGADQ